MYCMTTETRPKILSIQCKLFQSLVGNCLKTSYDLSSEDENTYYDLNTKHMILKELRSRAMRTSSKSNEHFNSLYKISNYNSANKQKEDNEDNSHLVSTESESFFSAKSNFSTCSSQGQIIPHWSMLEEFKHHPEGWPFGLWRRPVVLLPPLPPTPSNSWMWLRRNSESKAYIVTYLDHK